MTLTLTLAVAGFATGMLLASMSHFTLEHGPVVGGAATLASLLFLATVPSLARAARRCAGGGAAPRGGARRASQNRPARNR